MGRGGHRAYYRRGTDFSVPVKLREVWTQRERLTTSHWASHGFFPQCTPPNEVQQSPEQEE